MKKAILAGAASVALLVATPVAAQAAPGKEIKSRCGASFGQVVSGLQPGWDHPSGMVNNAKGGAKAFAGTLDIHCP